MGNNWAIVIGINHYDHHPERQLNYAVSDAQLMHDFLCYEAGFASEHVFLCLGDGDRTHPNYPTYANVLRLLNRDLHPNRIGQVDRLWFFFGGHGVSQNGRDYLLTSDSLIEDTELKIALPIDEVIASFRRHRTADIVLILDSCRHQQGSRKFILAETGRQTVELAQSQGITTIFSCDYGQSSYELSRLKHGTFSYALVEGLKRYTLPHTLEPYLRQTVAELNQHHEQTPRIRVEPASKAFQTLLPTIVTPADLTVLVDHAKEAELNEDLELAKKLWWQVIDVTASSEQRHEARSAIERINQKMAQLNRNSDQETTSSQAKPRQSPKSAKTSTSRTTKQTSPSSSSAKSRRTSSRTQRNPPLVPHFSTRREILQTAGIYTGLGLGGAFLIYKIFENSQPISVAKPKVIASDTVEFETVLLDERGSETQRSLRRAKFAKEPLGNGIELELIDIAGGRFQMGSPPTETGSSEAEQPYHQVELNSFWMSKYPITQAQWRAVANLPKVNIELNPDPSMFNGSDRPVEQVNWYEATEFCDRLSNLSRKAGRKYRLPSEAEWEFACRASTTTPFYFGEVITNRVVNYRGLGPDETMKVGTFPPNAFGLYDMHGNVWEWCADHWHNTYKGAPTDGSVWETGGNAAYRTIRGGSWNNISEDCRSANRNSATPGTAYNHLGFRVVCLFV